MTGIHQGLCDFNSILYAEWKGVIGDDGLWVSNFDGKNWSAQTKVPGVASSVGPSLAVFAGKLYAAWKGMGNDQTLWFSSFDGKNWTSQQQIPSVVSSIGPSLAVFAGKLYAAWKGWWDDQTLWFSSFDGKNWAAQQQIQNVWSSIGPSLAVFAGKLYAAWKGSYDDQRLWYSSYDGKNWAGQHQIPNVWSTIGPSLAVFAGKLYAAWKGSYDDQRLWFSSFDGKNWAAQQQIPGSSSSIGPSLTVFGGKLYAAWKGAGDDQRLWYSSYDGKNWAAQQNIPGFTAQDVVSAPPNGLHSHTNYFLYSYCKPLINVSVDIYVSEDIVWQSGINGSTIGFGFQLNADSPQNHKIGWQQYCITLVNDSILGDICNWSAVPNTPPKIIESFNLAKVPVSGTLPTGYHLKISLQNDAQGNVVGVTFSGEDSKGKKFSPVTKSLLSLPGVTSQDIAPINEFTVNLVGPYGGQASILSSGAGRIVYTAQNVLEVLNQQAACIDDSGMFTLENANSIYGDLSVIPDYIFAQSFNVSKMTTKALLPKIGKPHPGLPPPPSELLLIK